MSVSDLDRDLGGQVPKEDPERVSETFTEDLIHILFKQSEAGCNLLTRPSLGVGLAPRVSRP